MVRHKVTGRVTQEPGNIKGNLKTLYLFRRSQVTLMFQIILRSTVYMLKNLDTASAILSVYCKTSRCSLFMEGGQLTSLGAETLTSCAPLFDESDCVWWFETCIHWGGVVSFNMGAMPLEGIGKPGLRLLPPWPEDLCNVLPLRRQMWLTKPFSSPQVKQCLRASPAPTCLLNVTQI